MQWERRAVELANLTNPAFCSILLWDFIDKFVQKSEKGVDFPLLFLVLPLVLHKNTRKILPKNKQILIAKWVETHSHDLVLFPVQARQTVSYTREAIIFGLQHRMFKTMDDTSNQGKFKTTAFEFKDELRWPVDSEPKECRDKARLLGYWFAEIGDPTTAYRLFGVRP